MKLRYALLSLFIGLFIASCGGDGPTGPDPDPNNMVSEEIGSDGGKITSGDGNLTLTFPKGALSATETITIAPMDEQDLGDEFSELIDSLGIGTAYDLGPDGLQFDEPVTASIASDQSTALNDSTLQLSLGLMMTSSNGQAELLDSLRVEPVGDGTGEMQISGELSHFSTFAVTNTDESGLATASVTGIPNKLEVGTETNLTIQADVSFLKVEEALFKSLINKDDVFLANVTTPIPMNEINPGTENENFEISIPYVCTAVDANPFRGTVRIQLADNQPGNNSDFITQEELFIPLISVKQSVECVKEMPSEDTPDINSFDGELTGLTSLKFNLGFEYTGNIGNLQLKIDYGDGNSDQIDNSNLEETSENNFSTSWEYDYGSTGNFMPEVTATNTESGESDTKSGELQEVNLTVKKDGDGAGTVRGMTPDAPPFGAFEIIDCGSNCSQLYFFDPTFLALTVPTELTAEPADGSVFSGWSGDIGDANSESETVDVNMDQNRTVTATFEAKPTFTLEVDTDGEGEVSNDPGGNFGGDFTEKYYEGAIVTLTAHPADGWVFTGWVGHTDDENSETTCQGTGNCEVEMDQNRSIVANFEASNTLKEGVYTLPYTGSSLESFALLFQDVTTSSGKRYAHSQVTQQGESGFGNLSGTFPVAFSTAEKVVVVDLLTGELLEEINASSISPLYGVAGIAAKPNHESATFVIYGANGTGDIDLQGGGTFSSGGAFYDAVPAGGELFSGTYVKTGGSIMLQDYNTEYGYYSFPDGHGHVYGNKFADDRYPVSAWVPDSRDQNWPATISVGRNTETLASSVFLVKTDGSADPVRVSDVGQDARKVRCIAIEDTGDFLCGVTVFGEDKLALFTWDGETEPTAVGMVSVGDGPVNLDVQLLDNGNVGIVTTGFNDDTITELELTPAGSVVSNNSRAVPSECESPGHAKFVRDAASMKVLGTCYDSSNYFIVGSEL
ncbi:InlB B-repeat-containing protein [Fodinibius halophilus]|uniref:Bacterial repeat domain-containing protein n=1 Tax=Fodinibius halophilus TaxID=1736908 RepID=A0A6M1T7B1_9BACT|nr:hypothetical protein [Fodinibius halophilus]NGP89999.1 hypothetical protein [Fodinibius halophilus]